MFKLTQYILVVPEIIFAIMFYGGGLAALISIFTLIWGALRKKSKKYFAICTGIILSDTMFTNQAKATFPVAFAI